MRSVFFLIMETAGPENLFRSHPQTETPSVRKLMVFSTFPMKPSVTSTFNVTMEELLNSPVPTPLSLMSKLEAVSGRNKQANSPDSVMEKSSMKLMDFPAQAGMLLDHRICCKHIQFMLTPLTADIISHAITTRNPISLAAARETYLTAYPKSVSLLKRLMNANAGMLAQRTVLAQTTATQTVHVPRPFTNVSNRRSGQPPALTRPSV